MKSKTYTLGINIQRIVENDLTDLVIKKFVDSSFDSYKSFSYAAGYLQSTLGSALMLLPKKKRDSFLNQLMNDTKNLKKREEVYNA